MEIKNTTRVELEMEKDNIRFLQKTLSGLKLTVSELRKIRDCKISHYSRSPSKTSKYINLNMTNDSHQPSLARTYLSRQSGSLKHQRLNHNSRHPSHNQLKSLVRYSSGVNKGAISDKKRGKLGFFDKQRLTRAFVAVSPNMMRMKEIKSEKSVEKSSEVSMEYRLRKKRSTSKFIQTPTKKVFARPSSGDFHQSQVKIQHRLRARKSAVKLGTRSILIEKRQLEKRDTSKKSSEDLRNLFYQSIKTSNDHNSFSNEVASKTLDPKPKEKLVKEPRRMGLNYKRLNKSKKRKRLGVMKNSKYGSHRSGIAEIFEKRNTAKGSKKKIDAPGKRIHKTLSKKRIVKRQEDDEIIKVEFGKKRLIDAINFGSQKKMEEVVKPPKDPKVVKKALDNGIGMKDSSFINSDITFEALNQEIRSGGSGVSGKSFGLE